MLTIGKAIRLVREAKGMRASQLAQRVGISNPFLSLIEQGRRQPSLDVVDRLARALGVPTESLILLAKPRDSRLTSTHRGANGLVQAVRRLAEAEASLRQKLETEFCKDASA